MIEAPSAAHWSPWWVQGTYLWPSFFSYTFHFCWLASHDTLRRGYLSLFVYWFPMKEAKKRGCSPDNPFHAPRHSACAAEAEAEALPLILRRPPVSCAGNGDKGDRWLCGSKKTVDGRNPFQTTLKQTMGNGWLLVFSGEPSFQGILGGAGFRPSTLLPVYWVGRSPFREPSNYLVRSLRKSQRDKEVGTGEVGMDCISGSQGYDLVCFSDCLHLVSIAHILWLSRHLKGDPPITGPESLHGGHRNAR